MDRAPSDWKQDGEKLVLELKLKSFAEVIETVNKIAELAEVLNHHPNIEIKNYNELTVTTTTHSEGKLTEKDFELAEKINSLL